MRFAHFLVLALSATGLALPTADEWLQLKVKNVHRARAIRSAFEFAWDGYYENAFPNDELLPEDNVGGNSRNHWGATAVDALGTAILMEEVEIIGEILEHVKTIRFKDGSIDPISVFETTIRYMGGLLSAYDLLDGPFAHLGVDRVDVKMLLDKAKDVGDLLSEAFEVGSILPSKDIPRQKEDTTLADAGSLILEWTRLSDLTGEPKYGRLAREAEDALLQSIPKNLMTHEIPGLFPASVNVDDNMSSGGILEWGGGIDSFYEYLLKISIYDPGRFIQYRDNWVQAVNSTMKHLSSVPLGYEGKDILFLGHYHQLKNKFLPESGHLACFAGGNFLLGASILNNTEYRDFGLRLINGCHHTYVETTTGVGPDSWSWIPSECTGQGSLTSGWDCNFTSDVDWVRFAVQHGFYMPNGSGASYHLRPEVLESYYYAYRITGDEKYRDWAWAAWKAVDRATRVWNGFSGFWNVDATYGRVDHSNAQDSYFFAETLKYLYLIFNEKRERDVDSQGRNTWVFNTEGHPLRVVGNVSS